MTLVGRKWISNFLSNLFQLFVVPNPMENWFVTLIMCQNAIKTSFLYNISFLICDVKYICIICIRKKEFKRIIILCKKKLNTDQ